MNSPDPANLEAGLGKRRVEETFLSLIQAQRLAATLDRDTASLKNGEILPAGWHWTYFTPTAGRSALGADGHAERDGFLPAPLPRRMWAGGSIRFPGTLRIGEQATRTSTIQSIEQKDGRSGPLVFVTVLHQVTNQDGLAVEEEQNLVYLPETPPGKKAGGGTRPAIPIPDGADWSEAYTADEITLFRFSALTFNSHRIHYDAPYATEVEGYPGLVVHGPLLALLLLDGGIRHATEDPSAGDTSTAWLPQHFRYRALRPLFCDEVFQLSGRQPTPGTMKLWAAHPERGVATEAELVS
jgi:3-methylfumaryl-CoA hydratase